MDSVGPSLTRKRRWGVFLGVCALEGGQAGLAALIAAWLGRPWLGDLHWQWLDLLWGVAATGPLLVLFYWMLHSDWPSCGEVADFLERVARPLFGSWSIAQLALLCALAGIGEELLFRGLIQGALGDWLGWLPALLLASVLFGLCHSITWLYALAAAAIGLYLGGLWLITGNLLAPMVTHGLYDFVALIYFLRWHRPSSELAVSSIEAADPPENATHSQSHASG